MIPSSLGNKRYADSRTGWEVRLGTYPTCLTYEVGVRLVQLGGISGLAGIVPQDLSQIQQYHTYSLHLTLKNLGLNLNLISSLFTFCLTAELPDLKFLTLPIPFTSF